MALKKLLTPEIRKQAVTYAVISLGRSVRKACLVVGMTRAGYDYRPVVADRDEKLRVRERELAHQRRRFGCSLIHLLLQREGLVVNHKRTSTDSIVTGCRFRALAIVDDYSRECPAIEVDTSLGGHRVVQVLEGLAESRGLPEVITLDNGPEFTGKALDEWTYSRGVELSVVRPGKPIENAYAESFIGRLRDECLNENWFLSLGDVRGIIKSWRIDYNDGRPHGSLRGLSPREYVEKTGRTLIAVGL